MTETQRDKLKNLLEVLFRRLGESLHQPAIVSNPFHPEHEQFCKRLVNSVREELEARVVHRIEVLELFLKFQSNDEVIRERKIDELLLHVEMLVRAQDLLIGIMFGHFGGTKQGGTKMSPGFRFLSKARAFCLRFLNKACPTGFRLLGDECAQRSRKSSENRSAKSAERGNC